MRLSYWVCRLWCQGAVTMLLNARVFNTRFVPQKGGVLLLCNHQSFMDPVLVTMSLYREGTYMARDSLFNNRWFRSLIRFLNAFPVRRGEADLTAIKESLRRLKQGQCIVIFPEGTRTEDGHINAMLPGPGAIAKKAQVPIVPTLIDGMVQAWPRNRLLPGKGEIIVEYGRPILPEEYADLTPEALVTQVRDRLIAMQERWHSRVPQRRLEWWESPAKVAIEQL